MLPVPHTREVEREREREGHAHGRREDERRDEGERGGGDSPRGFSCRLSAT